MLDGSQPNQTSDFHPFADIFPLIDGQPFDDLVEDIRKNGLRFPIVVYENKILDGRNRYRAAVKVGAHLQFEQYTGADPLGFVISANLHRRHLNESQRALVAAKLATRPRGGQIKGQISPRMTQPEAARLLNVGTRSVKAAAVVRDNAVQEIISRVSSGDVPVSVAEKIAKLPEDHQRELAEEPTKALKSSIQRIERERRVAVLAGPMAATREGANQKLYALLMADPPWRVQPSRGDGSADDRYPAMSTEDICKLKPPAASDAALFMWATSPVLIDALKVMEAWGFTYRSEIIWLKDRVGSGDWFKSCHEILLFGTRGTVPPPTSGQQLRSLMMSGVGQRRIKPQVFFDMARQMFPGLPCVEMFARERRPDWDQWGAELNQLGSALPAF